MPAEHSDLTAIEIWHAWDHNRHTVYLSEDKINWIECPWLNNTNGEKQQNFSIPALPTDGGGDVGGAGMPIRYIRDHLNGSDINQYSHWVEIQAYDSNGVNVALGKTVTGEFEQAGQPPSVVTDGDLNTNMFFEQVQDSAWTYVDLGGLYTIKEIKVWHYINRIYRETKTEVSTDNINWITVFDSAISGTYSETAEGHSILLSSEPQPNNFEAAAALNFNLSEATGQTFTQDYIETPIHWIGGQNVSVSQDGTLTKTSGGGSWNAGAHSSQQSDGTTNFIIEFVPNSTNTRVAFGLDEFIDPIEYDTKAIDFSWEINPNGLTEIHVNRDNYFNGTYAAGDIFQVALINGTIFFYQNGQVIYENIAPINFPIFADTAIYNEGEVVKARLYVKNEAQNFVQNAVLNISFTESVTKQYTANGYSFNQWTLTFLDYYFYSDTLYTAKGYSFGAASIDQIVLDEAAAQSYTAKGYSFIETDQENILLDFSANQDYTAKGYELTSGAEEDFLLDFAAAQQYTPQGYNFEQGTQANIYVSFMGGQSYTAEGYDVAAMAQENILLVFIAGQVYTPRGLSFEATSQDEFLLSETATQDFTAHFENNAQLNFSLSIQATQNINEVGYSNATAAAETLEINFAATQDFAAHFESTKAESFNLIMTAAQDYTAIGYTNEATTAETIILGLEGVQDFAAHFEAIQAEQIELTFSASQVFQANFIGQASRTIYFEDSATAAADFSKGLVFDQSTLENFSLSEAATQTFTAFEGYAFIQNASNDFSISETALSHYELGETGVYHQWATNSIYLQQTSEKTYTKNWVEFESSAGENFINEFYSEAFSDYQNINHFEANAAENLTFYISPLQFYGKDLRATAQENFELSINAISEQNITHLDFEASATEFFYIHSTDISLHQINYLTIHQNMFYDFVFWDYADQFYKQNFISFAAQTIENHFSLSIEAGEKYINANAMQAETTENFGLIVQAFSSYEHINTFRSIASETLDLTAFGTLLNVTEPREHFLNAHLDINLKVIKWIYFESDIYKPTYKIEITKPNTIWEPTQEDRPLVERNKIPQQGVDISDTIFSDQNIYKVDRRILNLTKVKGPTKITYEAESQKTNSLYTVHNDDQGGLLND